jgi:MFS family permease
MPWLIPCLLAFIASFSVMVIELVAGRLIAKHVGQSLYTWTSVIGVVLGGIMCGNLIGGRLADRFDTRQTAALLFLAGALACAAIPSLDYRIGDLDMLSGLENWPLHIALHVFIVFFVPATILGLIGPVVAKMALDGAAETGRTVGNVYGWGAFGSISGTFATGFFLIGRFGTIAIIVGVAALLAIVGVVLLTRQRVTAALAAVLVIGTILVRGPWTWTRQGSRLVAHVPCSTCFYVDESAYSYIQVMDMDGDGTRELTLDDLIHSYYIPDAPTSLRYPYERTYASVTNAAVGNRPTLRTFFLGGGGYVFPRYVKAHWPGSVVDIAEIDPAVTRADVNAFGLDAAILRFGGPADLRRGGLEHGPDGRPVRQAGEAIDVFHEDARNAVTDLIAAKRDGRLEPFDVVYGDAFNDYAVPFHLVTREFTANVRSLLDPATGLYLVNVIDIFSEGRFLGAVYNTLRAVFPYVYIVGTEAPSNDPGERDTFVVVGSQRALDLSALGQDSDPNGGVLLTAKDLADLAPRSGGMVLTDDFSPVENLLEVVVRRRGRSHQDR